MDDPKFKRLLESNHPDETIDDIDITTTPEDTHIKDEMISAFDTATISGKDEQQHHVEKEIDVTLDHSADQSDVKDKILGSFDEINMDNLSKERREFSRHKAGNKVVMTVKATGRGYPGTLINLSEGGFMIKIKASNLELNATVIVEIFGDQNLSSGIYQCKVVNLPDSQFGAAKSHRVALEVVGSSQRGMENLKKATNK